MLLSNEATVPNADDAADPAPGGRCGRYVVMGRLGAGGMGIVLLAHDPALDRRVALKVLKPREGLSSSEGVARIEREAKAMARLAHPNVVTVFDVDRIGDRMFVAMELVEGTTLRGWLNERPRAWRDIVEMFVAAGHGLAAAHAAGLVHRDFKPDNVLIGADGRPRVSDFGLVIDGAELSDPDASTDFTARGSVVGTRAYMSPEQWAGDSVDARSDQFAFCVALWEALWGQRPYQGTTAVELRTAIEAGAPVESSGGRRIPRRLQAALRRGLASDPAERWPDVPALLAVLARTSARRRVAVVAIAAIAALASAGIAVLALHGDAAADPCAAPTERLAAVWNPARRTAVGAKLAAVDPVQGANRFAKIVETLEPGAQRWTAMHVEACRATRVEGRQSDTLLDRRMECLDRWLTELADTVGVLEQVGDVAAIDHALPAALGLSPLAACADLSALAEVMPPPAGAAQRAEAVVINQQVIELNVERRAGRLIGLPAKIRALVDSARRLDHAPTLAAALAVQVRIDHTVGDEADAELVVRELTQVAARARDDRNVAFAWIDLITTLRDHDAKPAEAIALFPTATTALLRAGDPPDLRANLLYNEATVLDYGPHPAEGLALLIQARHVLEQAGADTPGSPLAWRLADVVFELAASHALLGELDAALASNREAIERWRAVFGPDSPDEAFGWHNLGSVLQQEDKLDDAVAALRTAVRIREARLGDSAMTATSLATLASMVSNQGHFDEALTIYDRALKIDRALLPADDLQIGSALFGRAVTLGHLDRLEEAGHGYDDAVALYERAGAENIDVAVALDDRGGLHSQRGRYDDALRDHVRAAAMAEKVGGPRTRYLISPLVGQAGSLLHLRRPAAAIPLLERALQLPADPVDVIDVAMARAYLGRARVETRRDVTGGLAMVRAARVVIATDDGRAATVRELDRWLAAQHR